MKKTITCRMWAMPLLLSLFLVSFVANAQTTRKVKFYCEPEDAGILYVNGEQVATGTTMNIVPGTTLNLQANVAGDNIVFTEWTVNSGNESGFADMQSATTTYTVPEGSVNVRIYANFQRQVTKYTVTAHVVPDVIPYENYVVGTVTPNPRQVEENLTTTLVVNRTDDRYNFQGWYLSNDPTTERLSSSYDYETGAITADSPKDYYALFTYVNQPHTVSVTATDGGSATITYFGNTSTSIDNIPEESEFTLQASQPAQNYEWLGWSIEGNSHILSTDNPYTRSLPQFSDNTTFVANYANTVATYSVTVGIKNGDDVGGTPRANEQESLTALDYGTEVTLNPGISNPDNWSFVGWYIDYNNDGDLTADELLSDQAGYSFNIHADMVIYARYRHNPWPFLISSNPQNIGTFVTSGISNNTAEHKARVSVTANVTNAQRQFYRFNNWTGTISSTNNPLTINSVTQAYNLVANFSKTYPFSATADNGGNVTIQTNAVLRDNGSYDEGSSFTVTAATNIAGKEFAYWIVNDNVTDNSNSVYTVSSLSESTTLVAHYVNTHTVTVSTNPGTISDLELSINGNPFIPGQTYTIREGEHVVVNVENFNHTAYNFSKWTLANSTEPLPGSNEMSASFDMGTSDVALKVHFTTTAPTHTVTTVVSDNHGTIVSDRFTIVNGIIENVIDGASLDLQAVPASDDYVFDYWMVGNQRYNYNPMRQNEVVITDNTTITAYFKSSALVRVNVTTNPVDPNISVRINQVSRTTYECESGNNEILIEAASAIASHQFWVWMVDGTPQGTPGNATLRLTNITSDVNVVAWFFIPDNSNDAELLEFTPDSTEVIRVKPAYRSIVTSVSIPATANGVRVIRDHAFEGCASLEHLYLAPTVTTIGKYAFSNCVALTEMEIPNANATIDSFAFYNCNALREVALPANLAVIKGGLFSGCTSLFDIDIPATVSDIEGQAFMGCRSLFSLELPSALRTVGNQAFMGMNDLRFVTINEGVQTIGENAFDRSNNIAQTAFNGSLASWCNITFGNAMSNPVAKSHNLVLNGQMLTKAEIPAGVTTIKNFAFYYNTRIDTLVLPSTVTRIDSLAFYRNTNLRRIVLMGRPSDITVHPDAFSAINKNDVVVEVSCANYTANMVWEGFTNVVASGMPVVKVTQRPGGIVTITHRPACTDADYYYTLSATPARGFVFVGWSDGMTGEIRDIYPTSDMNISPIWAHDEEDAENGYDAYYSFEPDRYNPNPGASWFNIGTGANEWIVGDAVNGGYRGQNALYVTNDPEGTRSNTYSLGSSPYTYTELKFDVEGIYEIAFLTQVPDVPGHYLSVALIPVPEDAADDNFDHLDPHAADVKLLFDNITGDGTGWNDQTRLVEMAPEDLGWYRLAFFWNVTSEEEPAATSAAVDEIDIHFVRRSRLYTYYTHLYTSSDNEAFGYTHTGEVAEGASVAAEDAVTYQKYYYDDVIQIHAYPADGYRFVSWNDGNTDAHRTLNFIDLYNISQSSTPINSNYFTATFELIRDGYTVTVNINEPDAATEYGVDVLVGTATVGGRTRDFHEILPVTTINNGETATVVLNKPQAEWTFLGWLTENGDTIPDNPYVIPTNNVDVTVTAIMARYQNCEEEYARYFNDPHFNPYPPVDPTDHDIISDVNISVSRGQIIVSQSGGLEVKFYDVNGRLLDTRSDYNTIYFDVPVSGSYLVNVGNLITRRVVVIR